MADQGLNAVSSSRPSEAPAVVEVGAADVADHGTIFCPNPKMPLWAAHPRVFLDIVTTGDAKCPYCGTVYRLGAGEKVHRH